MPVSHPVRELSSLVTWPVPGYVLGLLDRARLTHLRVVPGSQTNKFNGLTVSVWDELRPSDRNGIQTFNDCRLPHDLQLVCCQHGLFTSSLHAEFSTVLKPNHMCLCIERDVAKH